MSESIGNIRFNEGEHTYVIESDLDKLCININKEICGAFWHNDKVKIIIENGKIIMERIDA